VTIIRYISNDPSILFKSSMRTVSSITDVGSNSIVETGATVSAEGTRPGANGACRFTGFAGSGLLDTAGQFSFTVDTAAISKNVSPTGSVGDVYAANTYLYSHGQVTIPYGRMWIDINNDMSMQMNTNDVAAGNINAHSLQNGSRSIITKSWTAAGVVDTYINGRLSGTGNRTDLATGMFDNIFIGSVRSGSGGLSMVNAIFSDFVISSNPVVLASNTSLPNLSYFGDSFVSQADVLGAAGYYRNNAKHVVDAAMFRDGVLTLGAVSGHSGATINDASGTPLQSFRAAYISTNPEPTVFQAGVNDCLAFTLAASFQVDLDDHISAILAATTGPMFIGTVPTVKFATGADIPGKVQNVANANDIIRAAPTRWNVANPADIGRVIVYDLFTHVGGEAPFADVFEGQRTGLNDDVHFSAKGQKMWGELVGQTISETIIGSNSGIMRDVIRSVI